MAGGWLPKQLTRLLWPHDPSQPVTGAAYRSRKKKRTAGSHISVFVYSTIDGLQPIQ